MMSKERDLLRTAIKIIEEHVSTTLLSKLSNFIYEVDELLAQPEQEQEQEPVAWMWTRKYGDGGYTDKVFQFLCDAEEYAKDSENLKTPDIITPLYRSPPKQEPLSEDEAHILCQNRTLIGGTLLELLRDVEKAHGIGGE